MYLPELTELKELNFPVDKTFAIPYRGDDHDLLVTIIPNAASDTGFEFEYWVDGIVNESFWASVMTNLLENGVLVIIISLLILCSIVCCF